ncbi:hypothetical protein OR16_11453 [Cupriavidus basilensis OR16]|uniref:Uncharacterized protein n=1 Tax=Cupriavidus basilensis OR16 TaxID=1127483 RepID=H1S3G6_9BURK|nr:hypothetical protein OR16_11453 [Cupriavidus basilensis OR16]
MLDLVAFVKPVLDEITGQDVRIWPVRQRVVTANWQIPDARSLTWSARTLEIEMAHDVAEAIASEPAQGQLRHPAAWSTT